MIEHSIDLAPHAARHSGTSWLMLAIAALFALYSAVSATTALRNWQEANDIAQRSGAQARQRRIAEATRSRDSRAGELARKHGQQLESRLGLPWSELFSGLELAARESGGEAVLMTMSTTPSNKGLQMALSCVASSPSAMLKYVRGLRAQVGVESARLVSQEKSTAAGPDGVSFQLNVIWVTP